MVVNKFTVFEQKLLIVRLHPAMRFIFFSTVLSQLVPSEVKEQNKTAEIKDKEEQETALLNFRNSKLVVEIEGQLTSEHPKIKFVVDEKLAKRLYTYQSSKAQRMGKTLSRPIMTA